MRWSATNKNGWGKLGADIPRKASAIVRKTALDVQGGAAERSRVDTGNMKNAWQTEMDGDMAATVYNNVEYAVHNEYGTVNMTAQPMLHPAMDAARAPFSAALRELFKQ